MSEKLGQEAAFPLYDSQSGNISWGMDRRFYAACAAMQGMLAHSTRYKPRESDKELHWHAALTKEAYEIADALLKQEDTGDESICICSYPIKSWNHNAGCYVCDNCGKKIKHQKS